MKGMTIEVSGPFDESAVAAVQGLSEELYRYKLGRMTDAMDIEQARLRAIGCRSAANALHELKAYPDSVVRLYEIIMGEY